MSLNLYFLFLLLNPSATIQQPSLQEVRVLFQKAEASEEAVEKMLDLLEEVDEQQPVLLAYKASATMMMAKHVFLPTSKLSRFNKGKKLLQQAVDTAPEKVEIRFLRFALQSATPAFVGYKSEMEEDKELLLKSLPELKDEDLKRMILPFLKKSEYLTEAEKQSLTQTQR